jgi:hypothetical protein
MLGPAGKLISIMPDVDYSNEDLIFSIHCTMTNSCPVTITTIANSTVTFNPGSFIRGAVYHIFIKSMKFDINKASFIGYKLLKSTLNT